MEVGKDRSGVDRLRVSINAARVGKHGEHCYLCTDVTGCITLVLATFVWSLTQGTGMNIRAVTKEQRAVISLVTRVRVDSSPCQSFIIH